MFDVGYSELLLIAIVALLVVGPKDLPRLLRTIGQWVGRGRSMARHVRAGFDTMMREAELEEMNKRWTAQNAAIMAASDPADEPDHEADTRIVAQPEIVPDAPQIAPAPLPPIKEGAGEQRVLPLDGEGLGEAGQSAPSPEVPKA